MKRRTKRKPLCQGCNPVGVGMPFNKHRGLMLCETCLRVGSALFAGFPVTAARLRMLRTERKAALQ